MTAYLKNTGPWKAKARLKNWSACSNKRVLWVLDFRGEKTSASYVKT